MVGPLNGYYLYEHITCRMNRCTWHINTGRNFQTIIANTCKRYGEGLFQNCIANYSLSMNKKRTNFSGYHYFIRSWCIRMQWMTVSVILERSSEIFGILEYPGFFGSTLLLRNNGYMKVYMLMTFEYLHADEMYIWIPGDLEFNYSAREGRQPIYAVGRYTVTDSNSPSPPTSPPP